jgi:hypothetical protein
MRDTLLASEFQTDFQLMFSDDQIADVSSEN